MERCPIYKIYFFMSVALEFSSHLAHLSSWCFAECTGHILYEYLEVLCQRSQLYGSSELT